MTRINEKSLKTRVLCAILCAVTFALVLLPTICRADIELPLIELGPAGKPIRAGDVNNDGNLNAKDVILIMKRALGPLPSGTVFDKKAADINKDGKINSRDVIAVMKIVIAAQK